MNKIFLLLLCPLIALASVTPDNLYENSASWPLHVTWNGQSSVGGGFPGILIRVEKDGRLLLDYGRDGIHLVNLDETDVVERANQIGTGAVKKDYPNFVAYTANMFDRYNAKGDTLNISPETLALRTNFLLIYCNDKTLGDGEVVQALSCLSVAAETDELQVLFVPTNFAFYNKLPEVELKHINMMTPHMAVGSLKMLSHDPRLDGSVTAVLIDREGKVQTFWRSNGLGENLATLQSIEAQLTAEVSGASQ